MPELTINESGLIKSTNKKLAIVGTASSSVDLAPYDDFSYDILTLAWRCDMKRSSVVIDPHRFDSERINVPANYLSWLADKKVPVYLQEKNPNVPLSVRIPIELLVINFGDYFASSIAYAVAIGILSGYEEIALYGIDLLDDSEYEYQRPNTEYLLGVAAGKGIKVVIPNTSALLKFNHRYGYDRNPTYGIMSPTFLQSRVEKYNAMYDEHSKHAIAADGARQAMSELLHAATTAKKGKLIND